MREHMRALDTWVVSDMKGNRTEMDKQWQQKGEEKWEGNLETRKNLRLEITWNTYCGTGPYLLFF